MRMGQLDLISAERKRSMFIQMSNLKMRLDEPQPFPKEHPKPYAKLVKAAIGDLADDADTITQVMKLPTDVFKRLYTSYLRAEKPEPSRLRLV